VAKKRDKKKVTPAPVVPPVVEKLAGVIDKVYTASSGSWVDTSVDMTQQSDTKTFVKRLRVMLEDVPDGEATIEERIDALAKTAKASISKHKDARRIVGGVLLITYERSGGTRGGFMLPLKETTLGLLQSQLKSATNYLDGHSICTPLFVVPDVAKEVS
jgi:hypothetical protein